MVAGIAAGFARIVPRDHVAAVGERRDPRIALIPGCGRVDQKFRTMLENGHHGVLRSRDAWTAARTGAQGIASALSPTSGEAESRIWRWLAHAPAVAPRL